MPKYTRAGAGAAAATFRLLFGRAPVHSFSRTQTNPLLHDMMRENEVWVNADVAARPGLDERRVRAAAEPGRRGQQPRAGQGHRSASAPTASTWCTASATPATVLQARATARAPATRSSITRYETDPLMGGTGMNVNFVTLEAEA